jgi:hypothetical protein
MQRSRMFGLMVAAAVVAASGNVLAAKTGAHVHGEATLQVVQDGATVTIHLESPLENLVGFEHAPRNDMQKQKVNAMAEKLRQPETLFALTPGAQCKPGSVQLTAPVLNLGGAEKNGRSEQKKDDGHAGLDAEMTFTCAVPAALKEIEVKLFEAFRGIHRIDAQVAGPRGQSAVKLTSRKRRLSW